MTALNNHVNKEIKLGFKVFKNKDDQLVMNIMDQFERKTSSNLLSIGGQVASNMLTNWVNFHLRHELRSLAGKGSSYEFKNSEGEVSWDYRQDVQYFGLHDLINSRGDVVRVSIDNHIGMKKVVEILNALGYSVSCDFDVEKNRMNKILLVKE